MIYYSYLILKYFVAETERKKTKEAYVQDIVLPPNRKNIIPPPNPKYKKAMSILPTPISEIESNGDENV